MGNKMYSTLKNDHLCYKKKNIHLPSADKYSTVIKAEICYIKVTIVMSFEQRT